MLELQTVCWVIHWSRLQEQHPRPRLSTERHIGTVHLTMNTRTVMFTQQNDSTVSELLITTATRIHRETEVNLLIWMTLDVPYGR